MKIRLKQETGNEFCSSSCLSLFLFCGSHFLASKHTNAPPYPSTFSCSESPGSYYLLPISTLSSLFSMAFSKSRLAVSTQLYTTLPPYFLFYYCLPSSPCIYYCLPSPRISDCLPFCIYACPVFVLLMILLLFPRLLYL